MKKGNLLSLLLAMMLLSPNFNDLQAQVNVLKDKAKQKTKIPIDKIVKKSKQVTQKTGKGVINWTDQYIEAKGMSAIDTARFKIPAQAKLMARRGAIVDAQRNLLEIVNGVRVVGETKVEDMVTTSDYIYTRVDGVIKGAKPVGEPHEQDGAMVVTLRIPLYDQEGLAPAVVDPEDKPEPKPEPKPDEDIPGMIGFNLDGKQYDPSLFPLIVDEEGNVLVDFRKIYDPSKGKFPKILNSSKDILKMAGVDKGVEIIDVIQAQDGKIVVSTETKKKFNWDKVLNTFTTVSKFLLLLI